MSVALLCALVLAQTEANRDDAIFGGPEAAITAPEPAAVDVSDAATEQRDAGFFDREGAQDTGMLLKQRTDDSDNKLVLGGKLYLRTEYNAYRDGVASEFPWQSPSYLDFYGDARPSERVRAYTSARLRYDFSVTEGALDTNGQVRRKQQIALNELWLKFDLERVVFVTAGRQVVRWGAGRFWNPTDFLNSQYKDPLAVFDERLGLALVKAHLPIESLGWNFYAVANLEDAARPDEVGGALRAEMVLGLAELSLTAAKRKGTPAQYGVDLSAGLGPIDLKGEVALQRGLSAPFYQGPFNLTGLSPPYDVTDLAEPTPSLRADSWFPRAVLGFEWGLKYSDDDALYVGGEYFYNSMGYRNVDKYAYLFMRGAYVPLYTGVHYAGAYVYLPAPGPFNNTTLLASALANLSDRSFLARFDYRVRILTYVDLLTHVAWHGGANGELHYGTDVPAPARALARYGQTCAEGASLMGDTGMSPEATQTFCQNGWHVTQPFVDVGVGLSLAF